MRRTLTLILIRLTGSLIVITTLALAGRAWIEASYQAAWQAGVNAAVTTGLQVGEAVRQDFRSRMLNLDRTGIAASLTAGGAPAGLARVLIIGPNDHVYLDSASTASGITPAKQLPHCVECHAQAKPPPATWLTFEPTTIRVATPIQGETTCSSCHVGSGSQYLGVILVDLSLAPVEAQARQVQTGRWVLIALAASTLAAVLFWVTGHLPGLRGQPASAWRPGWSRLRRWGSSLVLAGVSHRWWLAGSLAVVCVVAAAGLTTAHLENNNAFCIACHTTPETTYYARTLTTPSDLAASHAAEGLACIECHSGGGLLGRLGALTEGAGNAARFIVGQYQQPAVLSQPLGDDHCLKCHAAVVTANTPANHFHFYLAAWQQTPLGQTQTCMTCHPAHVTGANAKRPFAAQSASEPVCADCHAAATAGF